LVNRSKSLLLRFEMLLRFSHNDRHGNESYYRPLVCLVGYVTAFESVYPENNLFFGQNGLL